MTVEHFWQTVILYLTRPNLINRRYIGSKSIKCYQTQHDSLPESEIENVDIWSKFRIELLKYRLNLTELFSPPTVDELLSSNKVCLILRKLFRKQSLKSLQKNNEEPDIEYDSFIIYPHLQRFSIITLNEALVNNEQEFSFQKEQFSYAMIYDASTNKLRAEFILGTQSTSSKTPYWLENVLTPKLERWIEMSVETPTTKDDSSGANQIQGSITKISIETYCSHYNRLKSKYSLGLLQIWKNLEKTDPLKFIFEDIAIASYLLTLWEEERQKYGLIEPQSFVDVGCGNGLLVYILSQEGHPGSGIDVRRRTIWDHYGVELNLIEDQVDPLDPNSVERLPKADWMIGNHSDELTPWILLLASRTSSKTRIFLLPCCPFDFDGLKFQRTTEESRSQYQGYMDYLQNIAENFGFHTWRDKLRIPSTKRTCIVGYDRKFPNQQTFNTVSQEDGDELLKKYRQQSEKIVEERLKFRTQTMKLRQQEIVVRNCTKIDEHVRQRMLDIIVGLLFQHEKINFSQILSQFQDPEIVSALKNQCGGIQTFVRNHKHMFTIQDNKIQFQTIDGLRIPDGQEEREKVRACWFHANHPSGCPLSAEDCRYKH